MVKNLILLAVLLTFFNYPLQKYPVVYRLLQIIAIVMAIIIGVSK